MVVYSSHKESQGIRVRPETGPKKIPLFQNFWTIWVIGQLSRFCWFELRDHYAYLIALKPLLGRSDSWPGDGEGVEYGWNKSALLDPGQGVRIWGRLLIMRITLR